MNKKIDLEGTLIEYNNVLELLATESIIDKSQCIPKKLKVRGVYNFSKRGHIIYPIGKEMPLLEPGEGLRRPIATIIISEVTNYRFSTYRIYTKGKYVVTDIK